MSTTNIRTQRFDHVIVGAGAAGCVLAARLSEDPNQSVLLLEAGPVDSHRAIDTAHGAFELARSPLDWSYDTVAQPELDGRAVPVSGGRTLGGGGSINYHAWFRGHPDDYNGWVGAGMTGWGWSDVLPAFRRIEDHELGDSPLHGRGGPIPVVTPYDVDAVSTAFIAAGVDAGLRLNRDFTGTDLDGIGVMHSNLRQGRRVSAARGYLHPVAHRPNLNVRTQALAERVVFDGLRAVGVRYRDAAGRVITAAGDSVILSAGGVRSAQLLMLSGIGPAAHLADHGIAVHTDSPGVGANLQDHPAGMVVWPVRHGSTWADADTPANTARYLDHGRGPQASIGVMAGFLRCAAGATAPDVQLLGMLADLTGHPEPAFTCMVTLLVPTTRGRVLLRDADPATNPVLDLHHLADSEDRRLLIEGMRRAMDIGRSPVLHSVLDHPRLPAADDDDAIAAALRTSMISMNHPSGTCRAGTDAAAVVGPDLRVHGVDNLRVIDSSVMPVLPRANTHAASIMIGERGAELVAHG